MRADFVPLPLKIDALDDIPSAVRTYPASGATAMLPLTVANNWTATIIFCGGTNLRSDQWTTTWNIAGCVLEPSPFRTSLTGPRPSPLPCPVTPPTAVVSR